MGKLVAFSKFDNYFSELKNKGEVCSGTILDTNIIVSLMYEVKTNHEEVIEFLDQKIFKNNIDCYTNVVTTAEFINIYRRILLTENLVDAVDEASKFRLSKSSKALIKTRYGFYKHLQKTQGQDLIFSEGDIKKVRDTFPAIPFSGKDPWPMLTKSFLKEPLLRAYQAYGELGIKYISPNAEDQKVLFSKPLVFDDVIDISSTSGLAIFDSMIVNTLKASVFNFAITADIDLAYATLVDDKMKDIVAPDSVVSKLKKYNLKLQ